MPMPLVELAEVDSTSAHAAQLLRAGRPAPFAVVAERQTGGRGRRGTRWESPAGNLFLTLALPAPHGPAGAQSTLPLKAAVIVARAVRDWLGLRLTLKWPNDLLFAGRKLGGLLLEGSTKGDVAGEVLVGIGLNVALAPDVKGAAYEVTSLAEVLGREVAAADLARRLVAAFERDWDGLETADVPEAFEAFSVGVGQPWRGLDPDDAALLRAEPVRIDGSLPLAPLGSASDPIVLSSIDHLFEWAYQDRPESSGAAPLLIADIGNTTVKLAAYGAARDAAPEQAFVVAHRVGTSEAGDAGELRAALATLKEHAPARGWPLFYASVNPLAAQQLKDAARACGLEPVAIPKRPVRRWGAGYRLAELGADRLAAIEGALASLAPSARRHDSCLVVVACGTALTVDAVRADGEHLGGIIAPGLRTGLRALHEATGLLPDVPLGEPAAALALGHGTHQALAAGALHAAVGCVRSIESLALATPGIETSAILLTGGDAPQLAGALAAPVDPLLILRGLQAMALGGLAPAGARP
jgi:biotin-[acetyl-CoA-carboxylase] ligase BirA-like protein